MKALKFIFPTSLGTGVGGLISSLILSRVVTPVL